VRIALLASISAGVPQHTASHLCTFCKACRSVYAISDLSSSSALAVRQFGCSWRGRFFPCFLPSLGTFFLYDELCTCSLLSILNQRYILGPCLAWLSKLATLPILWAAALSSCHSRGPNGLVRLACYRCWCVVGI
jgi:hypothetical protein